MLNIINFPSAYGATSAAAYKPNLNVANYHTHNHSHPVNHHSHHAINQEETDNTENNKQS